MLTFVKSKVDVWVYPVVYKVVEWVDVLFDQTTNFQKRGEKFPFILQYLKKQN